MNYKKLFRRAGLISCAAALSLTMGGRTQAVVMPYTVRGDFETALASFTTYGFDDVSLPTSGSLIDSLKFDPTGYFNSAFTISVSNNGNGSDLFVKGPAASNHLGLVNTTQFIQYFDGSSQAIAMYVMFDSPVRAFGFDYNNVDTNDLDVHIDAFSTDFLVAPKNTMGFFGVISPSAVSAVLFTFTDQPNAGGGYIGFDNFTWGDPVAATPLPAALPLFGSGLVALGLIARRRKKRALA